MNVIAILDDAAARRPDAIAIVWGNPGRERTMTFGELIAASRHFGAAFRKAGLEPGDAVAIFLPMSGPLYAVMAAVLRAGMTAVFADPSCWKQSLQEAQAHLRIRGLVGTTMACALRVVTPVLRRIPVAFSTGIVLPGTLPLRQGAGAPMDGIECCAPADTALLTFTSGSTGVSKGVRRSHGMLAATHEILLRHLGLASGQVHVTVLPFFVFAHLGVGATSIVPPIDVRRPAEADPASLARQIRAWNATGIAASPYLLQRLAQAVEERPLPSMRTVFAGGAPVWPDVLDRLAAMAPNAQVAALYGATEAEPIACVRRGEWGAAERRAMAQGDGLLAGRPIGEIAIRIVRDRWPQDWPRCGQAEFEEARCATRAAGEIVVSGAHVSTGYLSSQADAANKIFVDGTAWHRTGDAGYFDEAGRLWLVGRCSGRIDSAAGALYPLRVEAALAAAPGIARATLVARAGKRLLVIERDRAAHPDCSDVLARLPWCEVDQVVELAAIPVDRRHHAKVDLPALQQMLGP